MADEKEKRLDEKELKRVLGSVWTKDVRAAEPSKKGFIVGDALRVYDEKTHWVLSFLKGTDEKTRRQWTKKLDDGKLDYKVGKDFES